MRGGNHHTCGKSQCPRQVGDCGCRHWTGQFDIHASCGKTGLQRRFRHITRNACPCRLVPSVFPVTAFWIAQVRVQPHNRASSQNRVIGAVPTRPRTPSVPKYLRDIVYSHPFQFTAFCQTLRASTVSATSWTRQYAGTVSGRNQRRCNTPRHALLRGLSVIAPIVALRDKPASNGKPK